MTRELQKTPFYKIQIGDSSGQNLVELPYQINRLIDKVEIKELFIEGGCTGSQFVITFNEGSREPFPTNENGNTNFSFPINTNGSDGLTNQPGMLADLNFKQAGGGLNFSTLIPNAAGIINDVGAIGADAADVVSEIASPNSPKLITLDKSVTTTKAITYLFQQRNQIKITWGYIEDLENTRSVRGYIGAIEFDYPENDHPKVTVTSLDTGMLFDQVAGVFATNFALQIPVGISAFGKPVTDFLDLDLKSTIIKFSAAAGLATPLVSDEFLKIKLDKHAIRIIPAGMSPQQYFSELAKKYDAYFKIFIDPNTGKDTIAFLSKREFSGKLVMDDSQILSYKTPGSLVKSVKLKAEFAAMTGNAQSGVNDKGQLVTVATNSSKNIAIAETHADLQDANPTGNNPVQAAKGGIKALKSPYAVGTHGASPEINDIGTTSRQVEARANCQMSNIIMVSLATIGFAKFRPGPWFVGGLGKRYSGVYYFREVSHTIDAAGGYTCRLEGSNQSDFGGTGKSAGGVAKTPGPTEQLNVGLVGKATAAFSAIESLITPGTASDKFNKIQESK